MKYGQRKEELDSWSSEASRRSKKNSKSKARGKDPNGKVKTSRAFKRPSYTKKSVSSRNIQENEEIINRYEPIRKELLRMLQCLDALEVKHFLDGHTDIQLVLDYLDILKWQCEIYLKYTQFKENKYAVKKF